MAQVNTKIMTKTLQQITDSQKEFQRLVSFPIDSITAKDRNEMAEKYLFKMIEEIIELRKEFPSVINPWSKSQKDEDVTRIKEELSDIFLFLINFVNIWGFKSDELLEILSRVQDNNFTHVKTKKIDILNAEIMKVPEPIVSPGTGVIDPKYLFIGQNPGQDLAKGEIAWKRPVRNSGLVLRTALDELGIDNDSYFTNLVKVPTEGNSEPTESQTEFWLEFLDREVEILRYNNPGMKIITLGAWVRNQLPAYTTIPHPANVLRGRYSQEEYKNLIKAVM